MNSDLICKVNLLRSKNQNVMLTAIAVLVAALFISALLPSILVRYLYAGQQLMAQPPLLEYVPVISFAVGIGYFLLAVIGNGLRYKRINYLLKQAELDVCCDSDKKVLAELKSLSESLVKKTKAKKKTKVKSKKETKAKKKSKKSKK